MNNLLRYKILPRLKIDRNFGKSCIIRKFHISRNEINSLSKFNRTIQSTLLNKYQNRSLFIKSETTPNPDSLKFIPEDPILPEGTFVEFKSSVEAVKSPLAKKLFRNNGVKNVFLGHDFVSITKDENVSWNELKPNVFSDLMEFFTSGEQILYDEIPVTDTTILPDDSETVAMIKELIETRIRPSIQDDGGDITYKGYIGGKVYIQLHGSCSGCPSSSVTLKNGIERMLMHWIPEVEGVASVETEEEFEEIKKQYNE